MFSAVCWGWPVNTTSFLACLVAFGAICFGAGALIFAFGCQRNSFDAWEVTTLDGEKWMFFDAKEVAAFTREVGLVAVRRLRVLT